MRGSVPNLYPKASARQDKHSHSVERGWCSCYPCLFDRTNQQIIQLVV